MKPAFSSADLDEAKEKLEAAGVVPEFGIVLGSGLGHLVREVENPLRIPYAEIPHMPRPTVVGHGGELVFGALGGKRVALLSGRAHLYEGHAPESSVFGVRVLARLGVRGVLLTNAAGGIASDLSPGRLMAITDHINLTGKSPLTGANDERLGPRFPDMSEAYDRNLTALLERVAKNNAITLARGVYAGLLGPSYETPAEIRMLGSLGASAVGMSTVLETIALRHLGVPVVAVSCITNLAAGLGQTTLNHEEVATVARQTETTFGKLVTEFLRAL